MPESCEILVIGDSNTEIGHITNGLNANLRQRYGAHGSGYIPLNEDKIGTVAPPIISVKNDEGWKKLDMYDAARLPPPHYSPDGNWVESLRPGATTTVAFTGTGADIYWLSQPDGGFINVELDAKTLSSINTNAPSLATCKTRIHAPTKGKHELFLTAGKGKVSLLGCDAQENSPGKRVVCHKWGNGWSSTKDFLNIVPDIFQSGLRKLAPNIIVLLLGSNDHNLDGTNPEDFKAQLVKLINRIKEAVPESLILLTSTYEGNSEPSRNVLPQYRARSYPAAAKETGVAYWDMAEWFGPFDQSRMLDEGHCNAKAGLEIGTEMFKQIALNFPDALPKEIKA